MSKFFRPYDPRQQLLLPPNLEDWLPEGHLARFVSDVVESLDLSGIYASYQDGRGAPPYHPVMVVKLLVYGYCTGVRSSRRLERATYDDVAFRYLSANQHPDHDSLAAFRQRHLPALAALFLQVLRLCQAAGLVKLGQVALDGSKVKANASKHKAMSYARMAKAEAELAAEVERLLKEAQQADDDEDDRFGKGRRGDELPDELARKESRLAKIREAKAALEAAARRQAEQQAAEAKAKNEACRQEEQRTGQKKKGKWFTEPDPDQAKPEDKAQRNFTDPESRIMVDGATKSYMQAYNAQIVVDAAAQVILAADVTAQAVDNRLFVPMLSQAIANGGAAPQVVLADAGYFSEANVSAFDDIEFYVPPNQREPGVNEVRGSGRPQHQAARSMRAKLASPEGKAIYKQRKAIVEPVFGQIKDARGIRAFLLRGLAKVQAEWQLICLTHNLLKLFRHQPQARFA